MDARRVLADCEVVGLIAESSPDYVKRVFAHWQAGRVVVPLRSADDDSRRELASVQSVDTATSGAGWLDAAFSPRSDDAPAQVGFTSGTEGEPKGVVLTHRNLADVVERLNAAMQVRGEIREYVGVPVMHSFGLGRCRAVCAAGGRAFIPARGFNPLEIQSMLESGSVNAISAVPSLWRVLLSAGVVSAQAARRVRWIEIGSQYMSAGEKLALRELFSNAVIVQHYGLTEASRTTFLEVHQAQGEQLESVGRATGQVEVRISDEGRIAVRGPHVATRLLTREGERDPRDPDGWLTTSDLGELRDGFLFFKGRADDVINCGGLKLSPEALEAHLRRSLGASGELAVCRVPDPIRGDGILVAVSHEVGAPDAEVLEAAVLAASAFGVSARGAVHVTRVDALPRTDNGKIKRAQLSKSYGDPKASVMAPPVQPSGGAHDLRAQLAVILGVNRVADTDTFVSLGGDSLRFIQACVVIERKLGFLPEQWEKRPIAELERLEPRASRTAQLEPSVLLRALAIVAIVVNHAGVFASLFPIDGAAMMLLMPSGYSFARFQMQRVIASGKARMALSALPRVIAPAMMLIALTQLRKRDFEPSALFLYHNFLNTPVPQSFWYIEVFVQIHLLLALLLCVPQVRAALRDHPWRSSLVAVVLAAAFSRGMPYLWSTEHLYNLVPHALLWNFVLGWCLLFATTPWQRAVNVVLVVALAATRLSSPSVLLWVLCGGLFLNFSPVLRLPIVLTRGLNALASASLYIYTSHFLILGPIAKALPAVGALGHAAVALGCGLLFWLAFERAWQVGARLLTRR